MSEITAEITQITVKAKVFYEEHSAVVTIEPMFEMEDTVEWGDSCPPDDELPDIEDSLVSKAHEEFCKYMTEQAGALDTYNKR